MASISARLGFIAITASLAMGAGQALAADFRFPVESAPEYISKPVELGSGWYLRGELGFSNNKGPLLAPELPDIRRGSWAIDLGAGYKFNNWLRSDATIGWNKQSDFTKVGELVTCPSQLVVVPGPSPGSILGYLWDTTHSTCSPNAASQLNKIDLLWNVYLDLGTWRGFSPFIGAGAGVSVLKASSTLKYFKTSDGSEYAADLTPSGTTTLNWVNPAGIPITTWTDGAGVVHKGQPPVAFDKQVWSRQYAKTSFNLAWALTGGVAYDITPQLKGELSYRYLNSGSFTSVSSPLVGAVKTSIDSHQMRVGFRYMMD